MPGGIPGGVGLPLYQPVSVPEQGRPGWTSHLALVLAGPLPHKPETAEALVVERAGKEADKREQRAGNNNETPGQVGSEELLRHEGPGLGARVGPL